MAKWFDSVPAPVDSDGEIVPLSTKKLYAGDGEALDVEFIGFNGRWVVKFDRADLFNLDWFHLSEPDSWERLLEDLTRASKGEEFHSVACAYVNSRGNMCGDCRLRGSCGRCTRGMLEDIESRVRKLRDEDDD